MNDDRKCMHDSRRIGHIRRIVRSGLLVCTLSVPAAWAQSTASISGSVKDPSGAVLPGVEVAVTQTDTALRRTAVTNETGSYTLTNLPVGPYRFEAALPGFRTYVQTGIVLQVNDTPSINVVLEVGQVSETVEVQANAALVETRSTGIGQIMDNQRVLELPLNGRQVTELILLSGTAIEGGTGATNPGNRNYPTTTLTVGGGLATGTTYTLDGATHNDPYNNLNLPMPFPDAMQEFKVETSGLTAQYGHHSAGAVNAVTKSGTNDFHGSLFEFVRNGAMNARNAFALDDDGIKRNQFGGTVGGPIIGNKLFFFGGHQTTIERARPSTQKKFIPTAEMLAGDFRRVASTQCRTVPVTLRAPFVSNQINPALFSPVALNIVKGLNAPPPDLCGETQYTRRVKVDEYLTVGRVDYQWTEKQSMFGRYYEARRNKPTDFDGKNLLSLNEEDLIQRVYTAAFGHTFLLSANTVSSFRASGIRTRMDKTPLQVGDLSQFGVSGLYIDPAFRGYNYLTIAGAGADGGNDWISTTRPNPGHYNTTAFQFSDDLSTVRGAHQLGFGVNWIHTNMNASSGVNGHPRPAFTEVFTGMGLGDFLLGRPNTYTQGNSNVSNPRQNYIGLYAQDTWKANSRLTMNAGIRWEPWLAASSGDRNAPGGNAKIVHFERTLYDAGVKSTIYPNAPAGFIFPGDPQYTEGSRFGQRHWLHFAPRLGLAWDPSGSGRMTIRAAGGIFFDMQEMWYYGGTGSAPPYGSTLVINQPVGGLDDPWRGFAGGNPFPVLASRNVGFYPNSAWGTLPFDQKPSYASQYNLSIQRQIGANWMASANYIGTNTVHIWGSTEGNPAIFNPAGFSGASTLGNRDLRRELRRKDSVNGQYVSTLETANDDGTANYQGLLLSVERRARAMTLRATYTWSHCITDQKETQNGLGSSSDVYPGMRYFHRGNCGGDRRQVFNASTVYQIPSFANSVARAIFGGWQISGIVRVQTGGYFNVSRGTDSGALTGSLGSGRPDQILANPYAEDRGVQPRLWLNPAAFGPALRGGANPYQPNQIWGNSGEYVGPGRITIDTGLSRTFRIMEGQSVQFRVEAFNMPNHLNPNNPVTNSATSTFGLIRTAGDPRIMQLALKYIF